MKQCPRCNNVEIEEHHNYCKICGLSVKQETAAMSTTVEKCIMKYCPEPGTLELDDGSYICDTCAEIMGELAP